MVWKAPVVQFKLARASITPFLKGWFMWIESRTPRLFGIGYVEFLWPSVSQCRGGLERVVSSRPNLLEQ
jgi:hypothetical protein